jgi:hypothetical protein
LFIGFKEISETGELTYEFGVIHWWERSVHVIRVRTKIGTQAIEFTQSDMRTLKCIKDGGA